MLSCYIAFLVFVLRCAVLCVAAPPFARQQRLHPNRLGYRKYRRHLAPRTRIY